MRRTVIHTLGCSKNLVDSEYLGGALRASGWQVSYEATTQPGDVLILNTCGFIGDAKEESIDHILRAAALRAAGHLDKLVVFGCLSQRYPSELAAEIPEVDHWFGARDLAPLLRLFHCAPDLTLGQPRYTSTPSHYAFLKIAEGCDRQCAFCAIPAIRGSFRSFPHQALVAEAQALAQQGVRELILIAQELTYYGHDRGDATALVTLLQALARIEGIEWIRLHYAYPRPFPEELIEWLATEPKACPYLDIPLQHIAEPVLQAMRRHHTGAYARELVDRLRASIPRLALRTTLIAGFPNETEDDFRELLDFVQHVQFDHLGVFTYSEEEGTHAAKHWPDAIPEEVKQARRDALMQAQMPISAARKAQHVGSVLPVILDARVDASTFTGRTQFDSPDVDGEVLVRDPSHALEVGQIARVRITGSDEYDLEAIYPPAEPRA